MEAASHLLMNFLHLVQIILVVVEAVDTLRVTREIHVKVQPVVPASSSSASIRRRQHEIRNRN